jgi:hypothetical protein
MNNEIELNEEQLAEVTGGSRSFDLTQIAQTAGSFTLQGNNVDAGVNVLALGGGKNSTTEALGQGAVVNTGNTAVSLNSNTLH